MRSPRWILQSLILSVTVNVALLGVFFYFLIRDNPLHFSYHPKEKFHSNQPPIPISFLERLPAVSYDHLLELLEDKRKMENGFQICEVALGALATFYHFDVERGLGRGKLSKHIWEYEGSHFVMFPGLTGIDFETLQLFARREKWPLTPQGLFEHIREKGIEKSDPELLRFFCHTPEFVLYETLFARTHLPIQKRIILNLALEGGWEKFATFLKEEQRGIDFSSEVRQKVLVGAMDEGSKTAAYLLLLTDVSFATYHLEDARLARMLELLNVKTAESLRFVQTIAASERIDPIRHKAIARIAEYMGGDPGEVAGHFYKKPGEKNLRPTFRSSAPAAPNPNSHIVQEGESLWLLARRYKISIEALMEANQMHSPVIRSGQTLKIPQ